MNSVFDQGQMFMRMWLDFAGKMASSGIGIDPTAAPPDMTRQMRSATLQAMTHMTEQFMRSPEYLSMMKQSVNASIQFRKQMNDMMTGVRHQTQGTALQDIDAVLSSVRHLETRMLESMEQMMEGLEAMGRRLDAMEAKERQDNGEKTPPPQQQQQQPPQPQPRQQQQQPPQPPPRQQQQQRPQPRQQQQQQRPGRRSSEKSQKPKE